MARGHRPRPNPDHPRDVHFRGRPNWRPVPASANPSSPSRGGGSGAVRRRWVPVDLTRVFRSHDGRQRPRPKLSPLALAFTVAEERVVGPKHARPLVRPPSQPPKTIVVDHKLAFVGGINISDSWQPTNQGGAGWVDMAVGIEGPGAEAIEVQIAATWNRQRHRNKKPAFAPTKLAAQDIGGLQPSKAPIDESVSVQILTNTHLRERFAIRRSILHAIRVAERDVLLVNPYFTPDRGIIRVLCQAARRRISVRLLVPETSDHKIVDYAARATFSRLLKAGVEIFRHPKMIHTKAVVVDRSFASIGSYNFDHFSLTYNLEMVANFADKRVAERTADQVETDINKADRLCLDAFDRRPWWQKRLERMAWSLRRWL